MMKIRKRNKRTGKIVEFDWEGSTPPTDADIAKIEQQQSKLTLPIQTEDTFDEAPGIEGGIGELSLGDRLKRHPLETVGEEGLNLLKKVFLEPIEPLVEAGRDVANTVAGKEGSATGERRSLAEDMFLEPAVNLGAILGMSPEASRAGARGAAAGAIEGAAGVPTLGDLLTLGLSKPVTGTARAARLADALAAGVNAGAGIVQAGEAEDIPSMAEGVARATLSAPMTGETGTTAARIIGDVVEGANRGPGLVGSRLGLVPRVSVRGPGEKKSLPHIDPIGNTTPLTIDQERNTISDVDLLQDIATSMDQQRDFESQFMREGEEAVRSLRRPGVEVPESENVFNMKPEDFAAIGESEADRRRKATDPFLKAFSPYNVDELTLGDLRTSERGAAGASKLKPVKSLPDEELAGEIDFIQEALNDELFVTNPTGAKVLSERFISLQEEQSRRSDPVQKLITLIEEAKPVQRATTEGYTAQKAERASALKDVYKNEQGEEAFSKAKQVLSGEYEKPAFNPARSKLSQADVDTLFNKIKDADIDVFEKPRASFALAKLLDEDVGVAPQQNEIEILDKVFGQDLTTALLAKRSLGKKLGDFVLEVGSIPRALASSLDLSAPLRQGKVLALSNPKIAINAFGDQLRAFASEKYYQEIDKAISSRPNRELYEQSGLYLSRRHKVNRGAKEEAFQSGLAEKLPILKHLVVPSERAYTTFLNKLRVDVFDSTVKSIQATGIELDQATLTGLAEWINIATGRGSLGKLERASNALTTIFFSPRFQASRLALLNPNTYVKLPAPVRKMALKNMAIMVGVNTALLSLMSLRDDVSVETDPRSADFAKIRKGETRLDPWAGLQPWARLFAQFRLDRLLTGGHSPFDDEPVMAGERKNPNTGNTVKANRADLIERFARTKLAPVPSAIVDIFKEKTIVGEDVDWSTTMSHFVPMILSDITEMIDEDGGFREDAAPEFIVPAILGEGVTTYDAR